MFTPSAEQQAILDYVATHKDNPGRKALAVRARAGCGKTSIIREIVFRNNARGIYCAFNSDIVKDVEPKLRGSQVFAKTFHAIGNAVVKAAIGAKNNLQPDANKYKALAEGLVNSDEGVLSHTDRQHMPKLLEALAHWTRVKLLPWEVGTKALALVDGQLKTNISDEGLAWAVQTLPKLMQAGEEALRYKHQMDFTDMIYWISRWDLKPQQHAWVLVDEAQDLNPMQRDIVARSLHNNGFIIIVGDNKQSIYAFSGADSDSFDLTCKMFNAHVLPMTVTRRCAKHIVSEAANIVPDFRAAESASEGIVGILHEDDLYKHVQLGEMILCRLKAPLMKTALSLIASNIPASIAGKELSKGLTRLAEAIWRSKESTWREYPRLALDYVADKTGILLQKGDEQGAENLADEVDAILTVYESRMPTNLEALNREIESLFSDADGGVKLATVHKSKGLEADTVYIIAPKKLPLLIDKLDKDNMPVQTPEQREQEWNLAYVAKTRAKQKLVYVWNEKPPIQAHYVQNLSPNLLTFETIAPPVVETVVSGEPATPTPAVSDSVPVSPVGETPAHLLNVPAALSNAEEFFVLDIETSGIGHEAQIVQIAVIDSAGKTRINTLIKPTKPIPAEVSKIHGITNELAAQGEDWQTIRQQLRQLLTGKTVVIYNAEFDLRMLRQTDQAHNINSAFWSAEFTSWCAMKAFARVYGERSRNGWAWKKLDEAAQFYDIPLSGSAHDALIDCQTTLNVVKGMLGQARLTHFENSPELSLAKSIADSPQLKPNDVAPVLPVPSNQPNNLTPKTSQSVPSTNPLPNNQSALSKGEAQAQLRASLRKLSLAQALVLREVLDAYIAELETQTISGS